MAGTSVRPRRASSPSESSAGSAASLNGPSRSTASLIAGASAARLASAGSAWAANASKRSAVGSSSRRKAGQQLEVALEVGAALRRGERGGAGARR